MNDVPSPDDLQASLNEALAMLRDYARDQPMTAADLVPLPSLLAQCEALCAAAPVPQNVRSVHHFACSGGTLISRCLAAMPNVTLLSEIDPLSQMQIRQVNKRMFLPTDLIYGAGVALRPVDSDTTVAMFTAALGELHKALTAQGRYLVLRDHAHSQFCSDTALPQRPTLHEMLEKAGPVLSVVTVRHPLDCYLSLIKNGWTNFTPFTLDEYASRHLDFLDRHRGLPLFRYEDFVADPNGVLKQICTALALPYLPDAESVISVVTISGDSGRSSTLIEARARRPVPDEIEAEIDRSPRYAALCTRLGYALRGEPVICGTIA